MRENKRGYDAMERLIVSVWHRAYPLNICILTLTSVCGISTAWFLRVIWQMYCKNDSPDPFVASSVPSTCLEVSRTRTHLYRYSVSSWDLLFTVLIMSSVSCLNRTLPVEPGPPCWTQPGRPCLCHPCHLTSDPVWLQSGALWVKPLTEPTDTNRTTFWHSAATLT